MKPPIFNQTITFQPALPCGTVTDLTYCGKPANVAIVWSNYGGFGFQPVCADCSEISARKHMIADLVLEANQNKGALPDERPEAADQPIVAAGLSA